MNKNPMNIGLIGLGKMGKLIAQRLMAARYGVIGYDPHAQLPQSDQFMQMATIAEVAHQVNIIWIMVPAGKPVDDVINELKPHLHPHAIIIDGGNSHFTDTVRRAEMLWNDTIHLLDCGTSGGIHAEHGLSLTIGGEKDAFAKAEPIFKALAAAHGYAHVGPAGAGHYVKMVHNGIEYALLQSYTEGLHLLHDGHYTHLDLEKITATWCHGAVIRSWLLERTRDVLKQDQKLAHVSGKVAESGMGQWAAEEAEQRKIPMPALQAALEVRAASRNNGGNYATKLIALLRQAFGGHQLLP